ncbi:MAG: hypothetical protein H6586_02880 [Flavobacteriales bacterium]|nr:hypothetical protein [Flavobacteriales bacterium]
MRLIFKAEHGFLQRVRFWILRSLVIVALIFLYIKIYEINPFFVNTFSILLILYLFIIEDEKILLYENYVIYKRYRFLNLIVFKKKIELSHLKDVIINSESIKRQWLFELFLGYNMRYSGEIRYIFKNGNVKKTLTHIYGVELYIFQDELRKLLASNLSLQNEGE